MSELGDRSLERVTFLAELHGSGVSDDRVRHVQEGRKSSTAQPHGRVSAVQVQAQRQVGDQAQDTCAWSGMKACFCDAPSRLGHTCQLQG